MSLREERPAAVEIERRRCQEEVSMIEAEELWRRDSGAMTNTLGDEDAVVILARDFNFPLEEAGRKGSERCPQNSR